MLMDPAGGAAGSVAGGITQLMGSGCSASPNSICHAYAMSWPANACAMSGPANTIRAAGAGTGGKGAKDCAGKGSGARIDGAAGTRVEGRVGSEGRPRDKGGSIAPFGIGVPPAGNKSVTGEGGMRRTAPLDGGSEGISWETERTMNLGYA